MKLHIFGRTTAVAIALVAAAATFTACGDDTEESSSGVADADLTEEVEVPEDFTTVTSAGTGYTISYSEDVPADLAETIACYFDAIYRGDFDDYLTYVNPTYQDAMEAALQENYGYGLDEDFESFQEALVSYAGTDDYTITEIVMELAETALADEYEEDTDFVDDYLSAYTSFLGDEFLDAIGENTTALYDICFTMYGVDGDGNAITIMDQLEILMAEEDGKFGAFG